MKSRLLLTGLLLSGLATGCSSASSPPIPSTAAQVEALTKDFDTWYRYTYARIQLARAYSPHGVDGRPLAKQAFLQQLATGRVLALRNGTEGQLPVYQLCPYPGGQDSAIRAASQQLAQEALRNAAWEGQRLPPFHWTDLKGVTYTSANTRGKVVVVKCWYTSCVACVDEFAAMDSLVARYRANPQVLVVSLALNQAQPLRAFLQQRPVQFAVIPASKAYLTDTLGVFEYPTHFVLGPGGQILHVTNRARDLAVALANAVPAARR
ncbi:redoxin domain-containing protein [Hymenobacter sp. HMF4947]|uniref:Redoxin domain-containing protein n=1 Tax=Hymenobacter ginkgonis TaxID=2682976 RepID=A0A7K1TLD7_9BACT|nr:TlpA disulfide reductase family protein [Hymenobacter ginkgonis]MVN79229.1 redoxin domain-containing protein [Hymenobacter ginkgonis]